MSSVLYCPNIDFVDSNEIKSLCLFYDNIYRIVPAGIIPDDSDELRPLLEHCSIGKSIEPTRYSKKASNQFMIDMKDYSAASLQDHDEQDVQFKKIHSDKADIELRNMFMDLGYGMQGDWIYVPTGLATDYMVYLAREIAMQNNLSLTTNRLHANTAMNYFQVNGSVGEFVVPCSNEMIEQYQIEYALFNIVVKNMVPYNLADISSQDILKFRESRRCEIVEFKKAISELYGAISTISENEIQVDEIVSAIKLYKTRLDEFRKSMDVMKVKAFGGISIMGIPAPASLAALLALEPVSTACLLVSGLVIGTAYNLEKYKVENRRETGKNPMAWLYYYKNELANGSYALIRERQWRSMEEFVND